jgi:uncharacterized protein
MPNEAAFDPTPLLASELSLPVAGVTAVVKLLADGSTVPFIARYRKEVTGGLDEVQIRAIEERRAYLLEFDERRRTVLASIAEQGKLTAELEARIRGCDTKAALEDLYLPYKPKRRTRATIAREKGLGPLADRILAQPASGQPVVEAAAFVKEDVESAEAALAGARDIVAEVVSEHAEVRALVRDSFNKDGLLVSQAVPEKTTEPTKYQQYYDYTEPVATIPSHRFLAVRRGEREGVLKVHLEVQAETLLPAVEAKMGLTAGSPFAGELRTAIADSFERLLAPSVETDVRVELKLRSDRDAVETFATNLKSLLLAPPLGERTVIGIDPGLRTGCKCVAVDATGKYLEAVTVYPSRGEAKVEEARRDLAAFIARYHPFAVAIGNGTGGRETETFARKVVSDAGMKEVVVVSVNEAGASVYSASDVAREEFPELDLTLRGAISIARRLQDPLAELVKIDPKAIGVGQYQHDVHQPLLAKKLDEVVESCVNHVGVELNTASVPLLARVAGIGPSLAKKIVVHRDQHGAFKKRHDLLAVSGFGPRTFEQAAGFLRIHGGEHPLDSSAVHPERYELVARMARDLGVGLQQLVGSGELARKIELRKYVGDGVGEPTLRDIVDELQKPGRDPRASFEPPKFRDDIAKLEDLQSGLELEGVVTNVTAFGAFVDIGVHQDGLVHISQLSHKFVKDPHEVVKAGDRLKVRVLEVDLARKRISLTARVEPAPAQAQAGDRRPPRRDDAPRGKPQGGGRPEQGARGQGRGGDKPRERESAPKNQFRNNPFSDLLRKG